MSRSVPLPSIPAVRPFRQLRGSLHAHESILAMLHTSNAPCPTQYTLIVLGTSSASPDCEQPAYRLTVNGDFDSAPVCSATLFYFELLAQSPLRGCVSC